MSFYEASVELVPVSLLIYASSCNMIYIRVWDISSSYYRLQKKFGAR